MRALFMRERFITFRFAFCNISNCRVPVPLCPAPDRGILLLCLLWRRVTCQRGSVAAIVVAKDDATHTLLYAFQSSWLWGQ